MDVSRYETSVTRAHRVDNKRVEPSLHNGRAKPGIAKHHQGKTEKEK